MSDEDDDLESYWADVRGPVQPRRPLPTVPLPPPTRTERRRQLVQAIFQAPTEIQVQVGLFTAQGEVTGEGYARVPVRMRIDERGATFTEGVTFPEALSDWGQVLTLGVFDVRGEAIFYLDINQPHAVLRGDSMNFPSVGVTID